METVDIKSLRTRYRRALERRRPWESHWAFSAWNRGDPNRAAILRAGTDDPVFRICRRIAQRAVTGALADPTDGATHYHHRDILPGWAVAHAPCAEIGAHLFYNDIA